jgi:flagellar hook protein FlgE
MASFYIPLSGLEADTTALNTIANDLANLNTTGFKAQTANFSDTFYQQIGEQGSGDPIQVGSGVDVSSIQSDFSQGSQISTDSASNVELVGNGFFVVNDGGANVYTRDGNFSVSQSGSLETQAGEQVMGFPATNGVVNTNAPLVGISLPVGQVQPAQATTSFGMAANLDSSAAIGTTLPAQVTVYDSLGQSHIATVTYTKTATNTWSYNVSMPDTLAAASNTAAGTTTLTYNFGSSGGTLATVDPGTSLAITGPTATGSATIAVPPVTAGETVAAYATSLQTAVTAAGLTGVTVASTAGGQLTITGANISTAGSVIQDPISANTTGTLTFNSSGDLTNPASNISGISFSGLSDGAANMTMNWNILGSAGTPTITQSDVGSAASGTTQNGFAAGSYNGFSIASDGTVNATFSNNQTVAVGQLALANVANPQGLDLLGDGNYAATQASGTASVGASGTAGLGTINDETLEASNVNISAEFSDLIIAQRAFEANSKGVTTFDTIAQETINMIH